jgi:hypothetical protein
VSLSRDGFPKFPKFLSFSQPESPQLRGAAGSIKRIHVIFSLLRLKKVLTVSHLYILTPRQPLFKMIFNTLIVATLAVLATATPTKRSHKVSHHRRSGHHGGIRRSGFHGSWRNNYLGRRHSYGGHSYQWGFSKSRVCVSTSNNHRETGDTVTTMTGPSVTEESLTRDPSTTTCSGDTRAETRPGDTIKLVPRDVSHPSPNAVFDLACLTLNRQLQQWKH